MKLKYHIKPFTNATAFVDFMIESGGLQVVIKEMTEAELVNLVDAATSALEEIKTHRLRGLRAPEL